MSDPPTDPDGGTGRDGSGSSDDPRTANADERTDPEQGRVDTDRKGRARTDPAALKWLSGVVALVGLWIAASTLVYDATAPARWNNLVTGAAVFLLACYSFYGVTERYRPDVGSTSLAALLGLWAVAAPFVLAYGSDGLVWSTMASGVAVATLSGYNAYEGRRTERARTAGNRA